MPPVSEAQRRLVFARAAKGEKWAKEWASEDPGGKLPKHHHKAKPKGHANHEPGYYSRRLKA